MRMNSVCGCEKASYHLGAHYNFPSAQRTTSIWGPKKELGSATEETLRDFSGKPFAQMISQAGGFWGMPLGRTSDTERVGRISCYRLFRTSKKWPRSTTHFSLRRHPVFRPATCNVRLRRQTSNTEKWLGLCSGLAHLVGPTSRGPWTCWHSPPPTTQPNERRRVQSVLLGTYWVPEIKVLQTPPC